MLLVSEMHFVYYTSKMYISIPSSAFFSVFINLSYSFFFLSFEYRTSIETENAGMGVTFTDYGEDAAVSCLL